jgi:predicted nucleic acid-binding protein
LIRQAVVDASVAVKWVVPEAHSEAALRLLIDGTALYAPGHWLAEVGTTLWAKSAMRGVLSREQALARVAWIGELDVQETDVRDLVVGATEIALDMGLTVYDTLYLALAVRIAAPVVTADRKLFDQAKSDRRYADAAMWVADVV